MMDPMEHARRAASLAWHKAEGRQLDINDHNALQHHVRRLAEQLDVPEAEVRRDLNTAAETAGTSWKAGQLFAGLVLDQ